MALAIERVEHELAPIIIQAGRLMRTRIWAADVRHVVIASSAPSDAVGGAVRTLLRTLGRDACMTLAAPRSLSCLGAHELVIERLCDEPVSPRLALALVELVASQSTRASEPPDHHELKNHFVYNLLFESSMDEEFLIRQGQILGIDLTIPRAAILIDASDFLLPSNALERTDLDEAIMRQRARTVISSVVNFFHLPSATICAYVGGGEIVILKASSARDLVAWADAPVEQTSDAFTPTWAGLPALKRAGEALLSHLRHDTGATIDIGIGRYHPGVRGLERSYHDAHTALTLGRHFHGRNQMHCLDSLGIAAFIGIADERTKVDLARKLLGPLDHEPELVETVETFFLLGCSPSLTANQLCVHRNTLNYRLEKVASLSGLDPRRFDDAVQIRLALLVRSLQR